MLDPRPAGTGCSTLDPQLVLSSRRRSSSVSRRLDPQFCCRSHPLVALALLCWTGPPVGSYTPHFPLCCCVTLWGCPVLESHCCRRHHSLGPRDVGTAQCSLDVPLLLHSPPCWSVPATGLRSPQSQCASPPRHSTTTYTITSKSQASAGWGVRMRFRRRGIVTGNYGLELTALPASHGFLIRGK